MPDEPKPDPRSDNERIADLRVGCEGSDPARSIYILRKDFQWLIELAEQSLGVTRPLSPKKKKKEEEINEDVSG